MAMVRTVVVIKVMRRWETVPIKLLIATRDSKYVIIWGSNSEHAYPVLIHVTPKHVLFVMGINSGPSEAVISAIILSHVICNALQ